MFVATRHITRSSSKEDKIDCDLSYDDKNCTNVWTKGSYKLKNSLDFKFGIIDDYRFDSKLNLIRTNYINYLSNVNYLDFHPLKEPYVFNVTHKKKEIPFTLINYNDEIVLEVETNGKFNKFDEFDQCASNKNKWIDVLIIVNKSVITFNCNNRKFHANVTFSKIKINPIADKLIIHNCK